jgi:hypothetical protein
MKAALEIELFGEDYRSMCKIYKRLLDDAMPELSEIVIGKNSPSGWVAEISGLDPKFRYARIFLKRKIDYSRSNAKGSRGVYAEYILESGRLYEVKYQTSWKNGERYFCTVTDDGDILRLKEEDMIKCLKSRLG